MLDQNEGWWHSKHRNSIVCVTKHTVLGRFVRDVRVVVAGAAITGSRVGVWPRWRYGNDEMLSSRLVDPPPSATPSQHNAYTCSVDKIAVILTKTTLILSLHYKWWYTSFNFTTDVATEISIKLHALSPAWWSDSNSNVITGYLSTTWSMICCWPYSQTPDSIKWHPRRSTKYGSWSD